VFLVVLLATSLAITSTAHAELIHGYTNLWNGGFDFSAQATTNDFDIGDVFLFHIFDPPLGWRLASFQSNGILGVSDSLDGVTTAPADTTQYGDLLEVMTGITYVVRTRDGLYAKFEFLVWEPWVTAQIEYYVQMDGSRDLDSTVPVESTSWGRVKALYSQ